jgi:hypothetical protein
MRTIYVRRKPKTNLPLLELARCHQVDAMKRWFLAIALTIPVAAFGQQPACKKTVTLLPTDLTDTRAVLMRIEHYQAQPASIGPIAAQCRG